MSTVTFDSVHKFELLRIDFGRGCRDFQRGTGMELGVAQSRLNANL
jgi:hypothetical protein